MAFGLGLVAGLFMGIGLGRTVLAKLKAGTTRHVSSTPHSQGHPI